MMRPACRQLALGAALAVLVSGAAFAQGAGDDLNDSVHLEDNSATNVKILEDSWKGVSFLLREGIPPTFQAVDRVKSTEYGNRVEEYAQAVEALRKGDCSGAERLFSAGLGKTKDAKQHQYFYAGLIEAAEGQNKPEAVRGYVKKMLSIKPAPRLIYDAYLKLGESYLKEGKFAEAETGYGQALKFFEGLEGQASTLGKAGVRNVVKRYRLRAKYWKIFCMEKQGKAKIEGSDGAKRAYNLFESEATGNPVLVYKAKIGMARCEAAIGRYDLALQSLTTIVKDLRAADPAEGGGAAALPEALVSLGDVHFLKLDYHQARWYYLTVIVRYAEDRAMLARAHYMAGMCYEKLRDKAREREAIPRALRHYEIVVKEFQDCVERSAAEERLEKLKGRLGA
jgi:tetratricopeptide (TPR) repeat protein